MDKFVALYSTNLLFDKANLLKMFQLLFIYILFISLYVFPTPFFDYFILCYAMFYGREMFVSDTDRRKDTLGHPASTMLVLVFLSFS